MSFHGRIGTARLRHNGERPGVKIKGGDYGTMLDALSALIRLHELEMCKDSLSESQRQRAEIEIQRCKEELPDSVLHRYAILKDRFGATAVAKYDRGVCSGCCLSIPRSTIQHAADNIFVCEHCGRLLFDPELAYFEPTAI
jgi:predicted  nucleic acid-binding Zn-ribbon protein